MLGLPKPPRPPKPLTQPLGPGWLTLMLRAATAPMLLAVPSAVMHWPTFSADGFAVTVLRYLLAELMMTVTLMFVPAVPAGAGRPAPSLDHEAGGGHRRDLAVGPAEGAVAECAPAAGRPRPRAEAGTGRGAAARAAPAAAEPAEPAAAEPGPADAVALDRGADGHAWWR